MNAKIIEVRDRATYIPVLAIRLDPSNSHERSMLRGAGFGERPWEYLPVTHLGRGHTQFYPADWGDRTMATAHQYIIEHFDELGPYDVVDVEFILGECDTVKKSEHLL